MTKKTAAPDALPCKSDAIADFSKVNFAQVDADADGQRLDNFLLARLKGLPRSRLYNLIRSDEIRVNKKRAKAHQRLAAGDVVRIAPVRLGARAEAVISQSAQQGLLRRVVFEDDGLLVLDKPHGLAVHGGSGESFGAIEILRAATGKAYLQLVHRIDKDTSGLLLVAKKRSVLRRLQTLFREKNVQKDYLCLVHGAFDAKNGRTIDKPLLRYTLAGGERRVKVDKAGKPSQTRIQTLAIVDIDGLTASLIKASPLTGRTHQIRVHMASCGHALLGDEKYQSPDRALLAQSKGVRRLCLHAWRLGVQTDAFCADFEAALPRDLACWIDEKTLRDLRIPHHKDS